MSVSQDDQTNRNQNSVGIVTHFSRSGIHRGYETAPAVKKRMEETFGDCVLEVETVDFLNALLPVSEEDLRRVVDRLDQNNWQHQIPTKITHENELYQPFVDAANGVKSAVDEMCPGHEFSHTSWLSQPNKPPKTSSKFFSKSRPDIVATLRSAPETEGVEGLGGRLSEREAAIAECEVEIEDLEGREKNPAVLELLKEKKKARADQKKEIQPDTCVWWNQIVAPVEVKPTSDDETKIEGSTQLCRYLRQVMQEQLDRRFAFGLLLCSSDLYVIMCDRTGRVRTKTPVNIHQDRDLFVRVLMAFSYVDRQTLGWDNSMKLFRDANTALYTTDPRVVLSDFRGGVYHMKWVITVYADGNPDGVEYVTEGVLNLIGAGDMVGRSTLVWVVNLLSEYGLKTAKRFALKQTWLAEDRLPEIEFLRPPGLPDLRDSSQYVTNIVVSGKVMLEGGKPDSTALIRANLPVGRCPCGRLGEQEPQTGSKRKQQQASPAEMEQQEPFALAPLAFSDDAAARSSLCRVKERVDRTLTRAVMTTTGVSIKFFSDLEELVKVLRDAIQGHRDLYFNGVLHRDISPNNILICPKAGSKDAHGCLIDLDQAKFVTKQISCNNSALDPDNVNSVVMSSKLNYALHLEDRQAESLLRRCGTTYDSTMYLGVAKNVHKPQPLSEVIDDILRFNELSADRLPGVPSAVPSDKKVNKITGTLAFMSYEVMCPHDLYTQSDIRTDTRIHAKQKIVLPPADHGAIHDLESFFWVLLYLCLTRKGGGGLWRDDLLNDDPESAKELKKIISDFFNAPDPYTMAVMKKGLFDRRINLDDLILSHFDTFFKPLRELLLRWWSLLRFAYNTYDDYAQGTIHDVILHLLDEQLDKMNKEKPNPGQGGGDVEEPIPADSDSQGAHDPPLDLSQYEAGMSPHRTLGRTTFPVNGNQQEPQSPTPHRSKKRPKLLPVAELEASAESDGMDESEIT